MDNLESLKEEEKELTKKMRISFLGWQIFFVSVLIISQWFDVPPFVSISLIIGFIVSIIIYWIFYKKVKKIQKEIEVIEKN